MTTPHSLPESFGVLKPVGHAILGWADETTARQADEALLQLGTPEVMLLRFTADQMAGLARAQLAQSSPVSNFGYEINLVREYLALAERGCHFRALPWTDERLEPIREVARRTGAVIAQAYDRLAVQDLLSHPGGPTSGERLAEQTGDTTNVPAHENRSVLEDPVARNAPGHHPARRAEQAEAEERERLQTRHPSKGHPASDPEAYERLGDAAKEPGGEIVPGSR